MIRLQKVFDRLASDLDQLDLRWAVIGGLAVSARAEPRSTRDVDVAVAVENDEEAERVVAALTARGYGIQSVLEHQLTGRMATVRFIAPGETVSGVLVDLFFASSGVEDKIVEAAEELEILPGTKAPVATIAHLVALKVLASRPRDLEDVRWLSKAATRSEIESAREALDLVKARGFDREKDLEVLLEAALSGSQSDDDGFVERRLPNDS